MVVYIDCTCPRLVMAIDKALHTLCSELCDLMEKAMTFEEYAKGKPDKRIYNAALRWSHLVAEPYKQLLNGQILKIDSNDVSPESAENRWLVFWSRGEKVLEKIMAESRKGKLNFSTLFNDRDKKTFIDLITSAQTKMRAHLEKSLGRKIEDSIRLVKET